MAAKMPIAECELAPGVRINLHHGDAGRAQQGAQVVLLAVAASEQAQDARLMLFSVVQRKVYQSARSQGLPIRLAPRCWRRPSSAAFSIAASMASSVAVASLMSARKASATISGHFRPGHGRCSRRGWRCYARRLVPAHWSRLAL